MVLEIRQSKYKDGLYDDQIAAFDGIVDWFINPLDPYERECTLEGFPGTGKTFLVARIVSELRDRRIKRPLRVAVVAPNHKALKNIEEMTVDNGLRECEILKLHFCTIHSLLHVRPTAPDQFGKTGLERNPGAQGPTPYEFDLVILDEMSMIGPVLADEIREYGRIPFLYMGDRDQVGPVDADNGEISKLFDTECRFVLSTPKRFNGCIAAYAGLLRTFKGGIPPLNLCEKEGGNLATFADKKQFAIQLLRNFREDPEGKVVLCFRNETVAKYNKQIRSLFYDKNRKFVIGETLVAKDDIMFFNGEYNNKAVGKCRTVKILKKDEDYKVMDFGSGVRLVVSIYVIRIQDTISKEVFKVESLHPSERDKVQELLSVFIEQTEKLAKQPGMSGKAAARWKALNTVCETFNIWVNRSTKRLYSRFQPIHASTVHMAQGGTYPTVYIDEKDFFKCMNPKERKRLCYTAATRPSGMLYGYSTRLFDKSLLGVA